VFEGTQARGSNGHLISTPSVSEGIKGSTKAGTLSVHMTCDPLAGARGTKQIRFWYRW